MDLLICTGSVLDSMVLDILSGALNTCFVSFLVLVCSCHLYSQQVLIFALQVGVRLV